MQKLESFYVIVFQYPEFGTLLHCQILFFIVKCPVTKVTSFKRVTSNGNMYYVKPFIYLEYLDSCKLFLIFRGTEGK